MPGGLLPEWLRVEFAVPIRPTRIEIWEANNGPFVSQLEMESATTGQRLPFPEWNQDFVSQGCGVMDHNISGSGHDPTSVVWITTAVDGWEAIDAVRLSGLAPCMPPSPPQSPPPPPSPPPPLNPYPPSDPPPPPPWYLPTITSGEAFNLAIVAPAFIVAFLVFWYLLVALSFYCCNDEYACIGDGRYTFPALFWPCHEAFNKLLPKLRSKEGKKARRERKKAEKEKRAKKEAKKAEKEESPPVKCIRYCCEGMIPPFCWRMALMSWCSGKCCPGDEDDDDDEEKYDAPPAHPTEPVRKKNKEGMLVDGLSWQRLVDAKGKPIKRRPKMGLELTKPEEGVQLLSEKLHEKEDDLCTKAGGGPSWNGPLIITFTQEEWDSFGIDLARINPEVNEKKDVMAELEKRDGKVGLREMLSTHDVTGGRVLYDSSRNRTIILDPEDKENNEAEEEFMDINEPFALRMMNRYVQASNGVYFKPVILDKHVITSLDDGEAALNKAVEKKRSAGKDEDVDAEWPPLKNRPPFSSLLSAAASANAMNSTYPTQLSSGGGSFPSLVPAEVHDAYETYSKFKYGTQTLDDGDLSHPTAKFSSKPGDTGKLAGTSCDLGHNNKDQRHHPNYTRAYHLADQPPWASNSITKLKALGKVPVGHGENAHSMGQLGDASSLTSHSVLPSTYMQPPRYNQLSIPGSTSFTAFSASHARLAPLSDGPSLSDELRRTTNAQTEALYGTPPRLSGMKAGDYDGTKRFVGSIEEIDGMAGGIRSDSVDAAAIAGRMPFGLPLGGDALP